MRETLLLLHKAVSFLDTLRPPQGQPKYPLIKGDGGVAGADADAGLLRTVQYAVAFGFPGY